MATPQMPLHEQLAQRYPDLSAKERSRLEGYLTRRIAEIRNGWTPSEHFIPMEELRRLARELEGPATGTG